MGVLILVLAVNHIASSRWACDVPDHLGYRFACDVAWILGAIAAVVAGLHVMVAERIWRGHLRGAAPGVVIALVGVLGSASLLPQEPSWLVFLALAGYLATLVILTYALIMGWRDRGRHATRS